MTLRDPDGFGGWRLPTSDALITNMQAWPEYYKPLNPHYVKNHINAPGTVRSWFRQMRAADFAKAQEGTIWHPIDPYRKGQRIQRVPCVRQDPWTLFDTQQVVERETEPRVELTSEGWRLPNAWTLFDLQDCIDAHEARVGFVRAMACNHQMRRVLIALWLHERRHVGVGEMLPIHTDRDIPPNHLQFLPAPRRDQRPALEERWRIEKLVSGGWDNLCMVPNERRAEPATLAMWDPWKFQFFALADCRLYFDVKCREFFLSPPGHRVHDDSYRVTRVPLYRNAPRRTWVDPYDAAGKLRKRFHALPVCCLVLVQQPARSAYIESIDRGEPATIGLR